MKPERLEELRQMAGAVDGSKSAWMDELISEVDRLNLQVEEYQKALKSLGQYLPAGLDPRADVTYQVFVPGDAIAPAWRLLHGVIEKPLNEKCWCAAKAESKEAVCPIHDVEKRKEGC